MTNALITGATGFLGRHLLSAALERGLDVRALSRSAESESWPDGVRAISADVGDEAALERAFSGTDVVFHLAGFVSRDPADAERLYESHVGGTKAVISACKRAKVRRLVFASSSGTIAVSSDDHHIATETDETPIALISKWPYYRAKLFAERAALEAASDDLEVVSVNPSLLLGPGDERGSSTSDIRLFLERRVPAIPKGGLSFVDVRDVAAAMLNAIDGGRSGERYLLGACNLTHRAFFERLERVSGVRAPWLPMPRARKVSRWGAEMLDRVLAKAGARLPVDPVTLEMAQYTWYLDASKAERELGFAPRDPSETLADTVRDLRERGVVWPSSDWERAS